MEDPVDMDEKMDEKEDERMDEKVEDDKNEETIEIDEGKVLLIAAALGIVVLVGLAFLFNVPQTIYTAIANMFTTDHQDTEETNVSATTTSEQITQLSNATESSNASDEEVEFQPEPDTSEEQDESENATEDQTNPVEKSCAVEDMEIVINDGDDVTYDRDVELTIRAKNAVACRVRNEDDEWKDNESGWFEFEGPEMEMDWELSSGHGTKEVYLQCKDEKGLISEEVYDRIRYKTRSHSGGGHGPRPSIEYLWINDYNVSELYTNYPRVVLYYKVYNASRCYASEGGSNWVEVHCSNGFPDAAYFDITPTEGIKTLYLKAENRYGIADMKTVRVIYDITPPTVNNLKARESYDPLGRPVVHLNWDCDEQGVTYKVYRYEHGSLGRLRPGDRPHVQFELIGTTDQPRWKDRNVTEGKKYSYYIVAEDRAGNVGPESEIVEITVESWRNPSPGRDRTEDATPVAPDDMACV